ncbi:RNA polymerase III-inhibiting protein maf1 [Cichlidogyrus casuarinus]|uniref:Repressor of RNA polymerase III transcription MAF1 homolog n=1 Tax=Cichlidogyrus casuarinus TaxID=1844966 RepID=A0ABD2QNX7_9PLAT
MVALMSKGSKRYCLDVKLECYSCKMVSEEKRRYKKFLKDRGFQGPSNSESEEHSAQETSPTNKSKVSEAKSAQLPLNVQQTIVNHDRYENEPDRVQFITPHELFCLIETMNVSFEPEYDFSCTRSNEFCLEPQFIDVEKYISDMCSIYLDKYSYLSHNLWSAIDEQIILKDSIIYSYQPDNNSDPYSQGVLDSFNYFFFNKSKNNERILFFSLRVLQQNLSSRAIDVSDDMLYDIY